MYNSRTILEYNRAWSPCADGFTVIEVLVVLTLVILVAKGALLVSFDSYRNSSFHTARASLISVLQHARAEAMNNVCVGTACTQGKSFGVSIQSNPNQYVLFQGASYASRDIDADESIDTSPTISYKGLSEIIFDAFSGTVAEPGDIVLLDTAGHISTTTIGSEGQISWSN